MVRSRAIGWPTWLMAAFGVCLVLAQAEAKEQATKGDPYLPYGGVSLQGGDPPSPKPPPPGFQYINWPGFRSDKKSGQAEVFLQLSGPVTYKARTRGRRVNVVLDRVQVYLKNNFRPVITEHFARQPVARFRLRQLRGSRIRLEIKLRRRVKPTVEMRTIGRYTYLVVAFPARRG